MLPSTAWNNICTVLITLDDKQSSFVSSVEMGILEHWTYLLGFSELPLT